MTIKASGCSALILSIGLWVCLAGPSAAAAVDGAAARPKATAPMALNKYAKKHGARHWKKVAHRKFGKLALKPAPRKALDIADDDGATPAALPPSIANANAQLASADTPAGNARALSERANTLLLATPSQAAPSDPAAAPPAADTQVVSSDQLNDLDRALHESKPPATTLAMVSASPPAAPVAAVMASGSENSWDQASLIGKIFIGFGALLTMASAARMFMA